MQDVAQIRVGLDARLAELRTRVAHIEAEFQQPLDDDFGEQAVDREDDQAQDAIELAALAEIELIEEAIARLEAGSYGVCTACGEDIMQKRLEALPACRLCITCAKAEERRAA
ncbi:MAG: TraR/DksA family transcriptional regulator [Sphingobium sp.]|uniref:TraR/DksA family transcriptional regulator n=1 Tax=Sphingobium sp. TaxID=1912891 RepID=UPI0029A29834|nr:TraR/DksA family transcriptional regulator [Sphingobium sp.]MDX3910960.1 TraR/DksA family transcriptional regulator [Sphingobium sp.]